MTQLRQTIREALESQQQPTTTILSSLLAVQDAIHYVPDEAVEETATFCKTTINEVWSVASFYTNFRFTPPGKSTLDICWGPSCHIMGAQRIIKAVQDELGVEGEDDTPDGRVTLRYSTCLGACAQAPVIGVDHHVIGKATSELAVATARKLRTHKGEPE